MRAASSGLFPQVPGIQSQVSCLGGQHFTDGAIAQHNSQSNSSRALDRKLFIQSSQVHIRVGSLLELSWEQEIGDRRSVLSRREIRKPNALQYSNLTVQKLPGPQFYLLLGSVQLLGSQSSPSPNFIRLRKKSEVNMKGKGSRGHGPPANTETGKADAWMLMRRMGKQPLWLPRPPPLADQLGTALTGI